MSGEDDACGALFPIIFILPTGAYGSLSFFILVLMIYLSYISGPDYLSADLPLVFLFVELSTASLHASARSSYSSIFFSSSTLGTTGGPVIRSISLELPTFFFYFILIYSTGISLLLLKLLILSFTSASNRFYRSSKTYLNFISLAFFL